MLSSLNLKGNIAGGVTAAIVALPLALAFGVASGLGATAGIYGAIILGFFASLLGGTPTQISGPTGPMTVIVASALVTLHGNVNLLVTVILLAGIFQILFSFAKIGRFINYIPYPVISGFMSGIGIIIIILQINPYLGLQSDASIVHILFTLPSLIPQTNMHSFLLATLTLFIMFFTPAKIAKIVPTPLIALALLTPLSVYFNFNVPTIGEIPTTLPDFVIPSLSVENYKIVITLAFTLALLGMIDSLLTSIVNDSITQTKHDSNMELFGQGVGNILCSFVGAVPGAGATMRTVINVKSGGTNRLSGMIHALTLLIVVLFFAPLASKIPLAILAGILIKVGIDILDYRFLKVWKKSPRHDLIVMVMVFLITVFIDLITAVGAGVVLSLYLIVYRITSETEIVISDNNSGRDLNYDLEPSNAKIIKINGAFFFGTSTVFASKVNSMLDTKTIIIDILDVPFIDLTAIFTLKDLISKLRKDNINVVLVLKEKHKEKLISLDITTIFNDIRFYKDIDEALQNI